MTKKDIAVIFKALGDENRIHILHLLHEGEECATNMLKQMNISQPTFSHHMKILCDAGIVTSHKEGKWIRYRLCHEGIAVLRSGIEKLLDACEKYENK